MNWQEWWYEHAALAARKSKDSTQVGAALIGPDGVVLLTAFNGIPRGVEDRAERRERPEKYLWAQHAERNLISFAAKHGIKTDGCSVVVTHVPCSQCAGGLVQAGIKRVFIGHQEVNPAGNWNHEQEVALIELGEASVEVVRL